MIYPWQQTLWQKFSQLQSAQTLPHAILLLGQPHTGKLHFAQTCARQLLSINPKNEALCDSPDGHPDQLYIESESDKLPIIKIDQIRQIRTFLSQTAQQGGYRIVVIQNAEQMNHAAANALLKILEEPGKNVLIFLLSAQSEQLLPTIRSRCQQWKIHVTYQQAQDFLNSHKGQLSMQQAWQLTAGQPLLLLLPDAQQHLIRKQVFLTACQQNQSPLTMAAQFKDFNLSILIDWLIEDSAQQISKAVSHLSSQQKHFDFLDKLYLAKAQLQKSISVNAQLFLESVLIEHHKL